MNAVSPAVRRCGDGGGQTTVTVRIIFEGARGTVKRAEANFGSRSHSLELARCVEQAVQPARVPPFRQSEFSVNFPFRL